MNLRLIANSKNSNIEEKRDALNLLNKFAENPEFLKNMLKDDFYVEKSAELINEKIDVLFEDLVFMK